MAKIHRNSLSYKTWEKLDYNIGYKSREINLIGESLKGSGVADSFTSSMLTNYLTFTKEAGHLRVYWKRDAEKGRADSPDPTAFVPDAFVPDVKSLASLRIILHLELPMTAENLEWVEEVQMDRGETIIKLDVV